MKEVELAVEEQELQKHAVVKRKFEEISKLEARIEELKEQLMKKVTMSRDLQNCRLELIGELCSSIYMRYRNKKIFVRTNKTFYFVYLKVTVTEVAI